MSRLLLKGPYAPGYQIPKRKREDRGEENESRQQQQQKEQQRRRMIAAKATQELRATRLELEQSRMQCEELRSKLSEAYVQSKEEDATRSDTTVARPTCSEETVARLTHELKQTGDKLRSCAEQFQCVFLQGLPIIPHLAEDGAIYDRGSLSVYCSNGARASPINPSRMVHRPPPATGEPSRLQAIVDILATEQPTHDQAMWNMERAVTLVDEGKWDDAKEYLKLPIREKIPEASEYRRMINAAVTLANKAGKDRRNEGYRRFLDSIMERLRTSMNDGKRDESESDESESDESESESEWGFSTR